MAEVLHGFHKAEARPKLRPWEVMILTLLLKEPFQYFSESMFKYMMLQHAISEKEKEQTLHGR